MELKRLKESQELTYRQLIVLSLFAIFMGLLVGGIDALFGRILLSISAFRDDHIFLLLPFLPLIGLFIVYLYQSYAGKAAQGMGLIFKVGQGEAEEIPFRLVPLVTITTWLTHLFGGSAGREGVAVQLGATLSHNLGRWLKLPNNPRHLLLMGMAAGFAGLFQTPIAATFFALEVLVIGQVNLGILIPTLLSSFVASATSHLLGLEKFSHPVAASLNLDVPHFLKLAILGLIFGLVGNLFAYSLSFVKTKVSQLWPAPKQRVFLGGILIMLLLLALWQGRYAGLGINLISLSFENGKIFAFDWLLKLVLTIFTLSLGFQGGEVTPLFAIGASLGLILGQVLGLPLVLVAALGYLSVFGSATNTFLAPIFIGIEVFGPQNVMAYVIVMAFAYMVNRKQSIYGQQKIIEI